MDFLGKCFIAHAYLLSNEFKPKWCDGQMRIYDTENDSHHMLFTNQKMLLLS